jgi:hypothetical protein
MRSWALRGSCRNFWAQRSWVEDALARSVVDGARSAYASQERRHLVWRRVWGVRLREEMLAIACRVADRAPDRAVLVWMWWDLQRRPVRAIPVAFEVPTRLALTELPRHLGPPAGEVGPGGVGSDLLPVSTGGESGVHLDYEHHADRDEYEMLVWGAHARPVPS